MAVPSDKKSVTVTIPLGVFHEMNIRRSISGLSKSDYVVLALFDYFRKEDNKQK